jgi:hypothetical protein
MEHDTEIGNAIQTTQPMTSHNNGATGRVVWKHMELTFDIGDEDQQVENTLKQVTNSIMNESHLDQSIRLRTPTL